MPSPFPGMDPYLEEPAGWPDVHHRLLTGLSDQLTAAAPGYFVRIEERVYVTDRWDDPGHGLLVPDLIVTEGRRAAGDGGAQPTGGALAVTPAVRIDLVAEPEVHDHYLEVVDARSRTVVTAIELLSPANKVAGSRGRAAMLKKRDLVTRAGAQWIEIDLLRAGVRHPQLAGRSDYCVALWPASAEWLQAWFFDLRDRLPVVAVPLRRPDPDAALDLQVVLDAVYDRGHFALSVDYGGPVPPPPLGLPDRAWMEQTLAAWRTARTGAGPRGE